MFVRSAYNYDRSRVSRETSTINDDEGAAQQSFKDECDINTIVRRFGLTGTMPQGIVPPTYATFEGIFDFHSAMNAIAEARESFDAMPADVRAKFLNDPQKFVEFCSDPKNLDEMRDMGLAIPAPVKDTIPTTTVVAPTGDDDAGNTKGRTVKGAKAPAKSDGDSGG